MSKAKKGETMTTGGRPRNSEFPSKRVVMSIRLDVAEFLKEEDDASAYFEQLVRQQPKFKHWRKSFTGIQWPDDKTQFSVSEAALYLDVDATTVRRWCLQGLLPYLTYDEPGKKVKAFILERDDLDALGEARKKVVRHGHREKGKGKAEGSNHPGSSGGDGQK